MWKKFLNFYYECFKISVLLSPIFILIGGYLIYNEYQFIQKADDITVKVTKIDVKKSEKKHLIYRTHFTLIDPNKKGISYAGNIWIAPKPHNLNDIVPAKIDWQNGVIKSNKMILFSQEMGQLCIAIGTIFFIIGGLLLKRKTVITHIKNLLKKIT